MTVYSESWQSVNYKKAKYCKTNSHLILLHVSLSTLILSLHSSSALLTLFSICQRVIDFFFEPQFYLYDAFLRQYHFSIYQSIKMTGRRVEKQN